MALRGLWRVRARPIPHPTSFGSAAATANATACAEKTRAGGEGGNAENNINAPQTLILGSRARGRRGLLQRCELRLCASFFSPRAARGRERHGRLAPARTSRLLAHVLIPRPAASQPLRRKRGQAGHGLGATLDTLPRGAGIAHGDSSKRSKRRPPASCRACGYDVRRTSNGVTDMLRSVLTLPRPSFACSLPWEGQG